MAIMKLSVWKMVVGEVIAFGYRLLALMQERPAGDTHLGDMDKQMSIEVDDASTAYDRSGTSPHTAAVGAAKKALDAALSQGVSAVRAQCRCIDEATANAADLVYAVLKRYAFGAPAKSNYVQSTSVMAMLKTMQTPQMQSAIVAAKAQDALAPIAPAHAAFEDALKQKVIANAPGGVSLAKTLRKLRHTIADTLGYLNRREMLFPNDYQALNQRINELVAEVTVNVRSRQTRAEANGANVKPTPVPVAPPTQPVVTPAAPVTPSAQVVTPPAQTVTPAVTPTPPATPAATTPTPAAPPAAPADESTTTPPTAPKADAAPEAGRLAA